LRRRKSFLALSYSILEAGRQWSEGGCTALADEQRSTNIPAASANALACAVAFICLRDRASLISPACPQPSIRAIKAANGTSSQLDACRETPLCDFQFWSGAEMDTGRDLDASGGEQA
jgi:hypothetical protein